MECNKDEARRAIDVAEKKISDNDYARNGKRKDDWYGVLGVDPLADDKNKCKGAEDAFKLGKKKALANITTTEYDIVYGFEGLEGWEEARNIVDDDATPIFDDMWHRTDKLIRKTKYGLEMTTCT
ncbi:unnamed protein product [Arabis nemorensis]|uniref:Uncharacterized protein n=1 Tax=Arabis nemorensis TaxID=586526 RepID=A0A565APJ6_9BRAS|nr:unnamed protein product [Arabis nemorensis]